MKIKYSRFEIINGTLYYGFIIITLMYILVLLDWVATIIFLIATTPPVFISKKEQCICQYFSFRIVNINQEHFQTKFLIVE